MPERDDKWKACLVIAIVQLLFVLFGVRLWQVHRINDFWIIVLGPWCRYFLDYIGEWGRAVTTWDIVLSCALLVAVCFMIAVRRWRQFIIVCVLFLIWLFSGCVYFMSWI